MGVIRGALVLSAVLAAMALPFAAAPASAKPLLGCGEIHAMGATYGLGKKHAKCDFVRRWARHYLKHGQEPPGWTCFGRFDEVGNCHTPGNDNLFQFFSED